MQVNRRGLLAVFLVVALLTFFLPLVSLQIPILGNQSWSGYDAFSHISTLENSLSDAHRTSRTLQQDVTGQTFGNLPAPAPLSLQEIGLLPIEMGLAYGSALLSLLLCFGSARSTRFTTLLGTIASIAAILHILIANSDIHTWFATMMTDASQGQDDPLGLNKMAGLIANSVQIHPGPGLYVLAGTFLVGAMIAFQEVSVSPVEDVPMIYPHENPSSHQALIWIMGIVIVSVIGIAAYLRFAPKETKKQIALTPPTPSLPSVRPTPRTVGNEFFGWYPTGLPTPVVKALEQPDLTPNAGEQKRIVLGTMGEEANVIAAPEGDCGNIGCGWSITNAATNEVLLERGYGALHRLSSSTNDFVDLLEENRDVLELYRYNGTSYQIVRCYGRDDRGLAVEEECSDQSDVRTSPAAMD